MNILHIKRSQSFIKNLCTAGLVLCLMGQAFPCTATGMDEFNNSISGEESVLNSDRIQSDANIDNENESDEADEFDEIITEDGEAEEISADALLAEIDDDPEQDSNVNSDVDTAEADFFGDGADKENTEISPIMTAAPVLKKAELTEDGVHITWEACENAEQYRVFRKKAGSDKWSRVTTTAETEAYDSLQESGQTYFYTVRCVASDGERYMSPYDTKGLRIYYVACPMITSLNNKLAGIEIKWNKVSGAQQYRVYRKNSDGKWEKISTTTSCDFVYKKLPVGLEGVFTVRALDGKGKFVSAYSKQGKQIYRLGECTISTLKNKGNGVEITWKPQKGAEGYCVYRKSTGDRTYTLLKELPGAEVQSFTDLSNKTDGGKYAYAVRSYHGDFKSSAKAKTIYYLPAPDLVSLANNKENIVTASWKQMKNVSGYEVYCKTGNESFRQKFSGSKSIKKAISGFEYRKTYTIYVRSYKVVSGSVFYSGWSKKKEIHIEKGKNIDFTNLKKTINQIIRSKGGTWSVYIKELKGGSELSINNTSMYPASIIKLFCMASTYDQIQKGNLRQTSRINTLLTDMITVSDNESFNELVRRHSGSRGFLNGAGVVNQYLKANGYSGTECHSSLRPSSTTFTNDGKLNCSSAKDAGKILERIYYGECVSPEYSREMLNLLKRQTRRWKIPSGIPSGVVVANKTGENNTYQHDAAIVYGSKTTFILCIFSNSGENSGCEGIRQIASAVYRYLN